MQVVVSAAHRQVYMVGSHHTAWGARLSVCTTGSPLGWHWSTPMVTSAFVPHAVVQWCDRVCKVHFLQIQHGNLMQRVCVLACLP